MTLLLIVQVITLVICLFTYIAVRAANVRRAASGPPALPSIFQTRQMVQEGLLSPDDAGLVLAAQGYGPEIVVPLLKGWSSQPPAGGESGG